MYKVFVMSDYMQNAPSIRTYHTIGICKAVGVDTLSVVKRWDRITNYEIERMKKMAEDVCSRMNAGQSSPSIEITPMENTFNGRASP